MPKEETPVEILHRFFMETPKKKIKKLLKKYDKKKYEGPTVKEYFEEMNNKKNVLKLLRKKLNTKELILEFIDKLILEVKNGEKFTALDGFIIGLIYANSKHIAFILMSENQLPPMSDNAIQQLEQCIIWMSIKENDLIKIL